MFKKFHGTNLNPIQKNQMKTTQTVALKKLFPKAENIFGINPQKEPLTNSILKSFDGCENYTDEEATSLVESIRKIAKILFDLIEINNSICIGNQQTISLHINNYNTTEKLAA